MKKIILLLALVSSSSALAFTRSSSIKMLDDNETNYASNYTATTSSSGGGGGGSVMDFYNSLTRNEFKPTFASSGTCSSIPASVKKAYEEAVAFTKSCAAARIPENKKIAINDYSGDGAPAMFIFDTKGNCIRSLPITWGAGNPRTGALEACSTENSRKTPPGFHITARHRYGAKYNESNSLGLAGLCGQNSLGDRGILIHAARRPGTGSSWGCTGVPYDSFEEVKSLLGVGSLVYNYFGSSPRSNCSDRSGFEPTCDPENLAYQAAEESRGVEVRRQYRPSSGGSSGGSSGSSSGSRRKGTR